jgi:hypothetical protein
MKYRLTLLGGLAALAGLLAFGAPATAATRAPAAALSTGLISSSIPCTVGGVAQTCQLKVTSFQVVNGTLRAAGMVTGGGVTAPFQAPVQATGSCLLSATVCGNARTGHTPDYESWKRVLTGGSPQSRVLRACLRVLRSRVSASSTAVIRPVPFLSRPRPAAGARCLRPNPAPGSTWPARA